MLVADIIVALLNIGKLKDRVAVLEKHAATAEKAFDDIDRRLGTAVRGIAVERFDPYQGAGGQQSFASAFINEKGDGGVISGIHSRDGVRVYAKPISAFISERELSEEESRAIENAQKKLS
jgi:hypothetical protein